MKIFRVGKFIQALGILLMVSSSGGCVYLVIGGLGALGGYVVSPDTVEGVTDKELSEVWDAAVEVISIMGVIEEKQETSGSIAAKIQGARIYINILPIGQASVKMRVKARKAIFPKISIAQDVYVKIMSELQ